MADFHNNLGGALAGCGLADDAADCFRRALELRPDFPAARANLEQCRAAPPRRRPVPIPPPPAQGTAPSPGATPGWSVPVA